VRSTTTIAHTAIGRIGRPAFLRPQFGEGGKSKQNSRETMREIAKLCCKRQPFYQPDEPATISGPTNVSGADMHFPSFVFHRSKLVRTGSASRRDGAADADAGGKAFAGRRGRSMPNITRSAPRRWTARRRSFAGRRDRIRQPGRAGIYSDAQIEGWRKSSMPSMPRRADLSPALACRARLAIPRSSPAACCRWRLRRCDIGRVQDRDRG